MVSLREILRSRSFSKRDSRLNAFTIVELLIVIVIIGILAAVTIVAYNGIQERAKAASAKTLATNVSKKAEVYATLQGSYPNSGSDFANLAESRLDDPSVLSPSVPQDHNHVMYQACSSSPGYQVVYWTPAGPSAVTGGDITGCPSVEASIVTVVDARTVVDGGKYHTLALASDGKLYAWGQNNYGQLGDGTSSNRSSPVAVNASGVLNGKGVTFLAAGLWHSLVLASDGKAYAWGDNYSGELGDGTTSTRYSPVAVSTSGVLNGKTVTKVSAGWNYSMVLTSEGKIYSWGKNDYGQLGTGSTTERITPGPVDMTGALNGKTVVDIAAGVWHAFALTSDGSLYSWGRNDCGQLGDGTMTNRYSPVAVNMGDGLSGKTVKFVATGTLHSLLVASDNKAYAAGCNGNGQLGDGTTTNRSTFVQVNQTGVLNGKNIAYVGGGEQHSIAISQDGYGYAWGYNADGRLGDGTTTQRVVPTSIDTSGQLSGKRITAMDAGYYFSFAQSEGRLHSWGSNQYGRLGDGTTTDRLAPVGVLDPF